MTVTYHQFKIAVQEAACLNEVMILRFGSQELDCPACGYRSNFSQASKHRAYVCQICGYAVYPCVGTPFEKLRTPLTDWFFAIHLLTQSWKNSKELEIQADNPRPTAERLERDLTAFAPLTVNGAPFAGWLRIINAFVEEHGASASVSAAHAAKPLSGGSGAVAAFSSSGVVTAKEPQETAQSSLVSLGAVILGAVLAAGTTLLVFDWAEIPQPPDMFGEPILLPSSARPSFMLTAVEEDLKAAKAAVEAATKRPRGAAPPTSNSSDSSIEASDDPSERISFGPIKVERHLVDDIVRAGQVVGADPTLLMAMADKESSFSTAIKARTSSATGLFQFIERTWLGVVHDFGAKHGLEAEASAIQRVGNDFTVPSPAERKRILELRKNPYLSALLAGEMLKRDTLRIEGRLNRYLTAGEIYLIHFLGPEGARSLLAQIGEDPDRVAGDLLPKPARANRSIFGRRSVAAVHKHFEEIMATRLERYSEVRQLTGLVTPANATP